MCQNLNEFRVKILHSIVMMNNPRFPLDSVFGIAFRRARQALSIEGQTDLLISRNMIRSNRGLLGTTWGATNISTIQLSFDFVLN